MIKTERKTSLQPLSSRSSEISFCLLRRAVVSREVPYFFAYQTLRTLSWIIQQVQILFPA